MPPTLTPHDFVFNWRNTTLTERSGYQQHFMGLCALVGHPTPIEVDSKGESFTFEAGADKQSGGKGWADVWKKGYFAWEYKGNHKNLTKAYDQLLQYRESLQNPPLLVVSDFTQIHIHTNFTNTVKRIITLTLDDLLTPEGLATLRKLFYEPESFRSDETPEQVTQKAAVQFGRLSRMLAEKGVDPNEAAHFLIRILFSLFAEDIDLLPKHLLTKLAKNTRNRPDIFTASLSSLFAAMSTGGMFGTELVRHFNGGLFENANVLPMDHAMLDLLTEICDLDWGSIEPAILGTLFERSLDPAKRSQLGAFYTSKEDILLIVEPVLMAPLRRRWEEIRAKADDLHRQMQEATTKRTKDNRFDDLRKLLMGFAEEIAAVHVLDPACGSGNFLFVALKQLLDLQKEVIAHAGSFGLTAFFPTVSPEQLHGIEINSYARELAQATIWIGYIQWLNENGFGFPPEPILKPLQSIIEMDAILAYDENGKPVEPEWPKADVIIGNPPFLGGNKIRQELGNAYVESLFSLYENRVPASADLVCYWFERARTLITSNPIGRAGLLATNSIRNGSNRQVLQHIKNSGDIFMAWSDRPWILDGAAVRVSIIGFDNGQEVKHYLNGSLAVSINSDLSSTLDLSTAASLIENSNICFRSDEKGGPFDIDFPTAQKMLTAPANPNGRLNSDVVRPYINGLDVARHSRNMWVIDFGSDMTFEEAALYEAPFEYVRRVVKPFRDTVRNERERNYWWLHRRPAPDMRTAVSKLSRFIATPRVSKHRLFVWLPGNSIPDCQLYVFARDDDYFFGVLHSRLHEIWSLRMGSWLGAGNDPRYTPSSTFETFPFPWPPGKESQDDPRVQAIAEAAGDLGEKRDRWLNPADATEAELKKRTLTNLYNQRPAWLQMAHEKLDRAVLDAYGWPHDISDEEILSRLLALNLERANG